MFIKLLNERYKFQLNAKALLMMFKIQIVFKVFPEEF